MQTGQKDERKMGVKGKSEKFFFDPRQVDPRRLLKSSSWFGN